MKYKLNDCLFEPYVNKYIYSSDKGWCIYLFEEQLIALGATPELSTGEEECSNCQNLKPGKMIDVDDDDNCLYCGKPVYPKPIEGKMMAKGPESLSNLPKPIEGIEMPQRPGAMQLDMWNWMFKITVQTNLNTTAIKNMEGK